MRYQSTRGDAPTLDFGGALLAGLANDGGLYVPESWPQLSDADLRSMADLDYHEVAHRILSLFIGDAMASDDLAEITEAAYATFDHPDVVPLSELGDLHLAELWWGPTLSFKDVALQVLGRLFEHELTRRSDWVTIVGATSGDTGSAAIEDPCGLAGGWYTGPALMELALRHVVSVRNRLLESYREVMNLPL